MCTKICRGSDVMIVCIKFSAFVGSIKTMLSSCYMFYCWQFHEVLSKLNVLGQLVSKRFMYYLL